MIELELRELITRAHEKAARDGANGEHHALATQMIKWSEGFFHQND